MQILIIPAFSGGSPLLCSEMRAAVSYHRSIVSRMESRLKTSHT